MLPPPRVLPSYAGEAFVDDVYDDLFEPPGLEPTPKPETPGLLGLIDTLPDRLSGGEPSVPSKTSARRLLALIFLLIVLLVVALSIWTF